MDKLISFFSLFSQNTPIYIHHIPVKQRQKAIEHPLASKRLILDIYLPVGAISMLKTKIYSNIREYIFFSHTIYYRQYVTTTNIELQACTFFCLFVFDSYSNWSFAPKVSFDLKVWFLTLKSKCTSGAVTI